MASGNIIEYIMNLNTQKGTESLKKLAKSTQETLKKLVNIGSKSKISFSQMSKAAKQAGKSISSIKKLMILIILINKKIIMTFLKKLMIPINLKFLINFL